MRRPMVVVFTLVLASGAASLGCGDSKTLPGVDGGARGGASGAAGGKSATAGSAAGGASGSAGSASNGGPAGA